MGTLLRLLFQSPETALQVLLYLPWIISTVLTIMIAMRIWSGRHSEQRNIILTGAILSGLSFLMTNVVNYIVIPQYGFEVYQDNIYIIQAGNLLGSIGGLMFTWGIYRYFRDKPAPGSRNHSDELGGTSEDNPFIVRH